MAEIISVDSKKNQEPKREKLSAEQLDQQMDEYFMKGDPKIAEKKLEEQMDDYWAKKSTKEDAEEATQAEEKATEE